MLKRNGGKNLCQLTTSRPSSSRGDEKSPSKISIPFLRGRRDTLNRNSGLFSAPSNRPNTENPGHFGFGLGFQELKPKPGPTLGCIKKKSSEIVIFDDLWRYHP